MASQQVHATPDPVMTPFASHPPDSNPTPPASRSHELKQPCTDAPFGDLVRATRYLWEVPRSTILQAIATGRLARSQSVVPQGWLTKAIVRDCNFSDLRVFLGYEQPAVCWRCLRNSSSSRRVSAPRGREPMSIEELPPVMGAVLIVAGLALVGVSAWPRAAGTEKTTQVGALIIVVGAFLLGLSIFVSHGK